MFSCLVVPLFVFRGVASSSPCRAEQPLEHSLLVQLNSVLGSHTSNLPAVLNGLRCDGVIAGLLLSLMIELQCVYAFVFQHSVVTDKLHFHVGSIMTCLYATIRIKLH